MCQKLKEKEKKKKEKKKKRKNETRIKIEYKKLIIKQRNITRKGKKGTSHITIHTKRDIQKINNTLTIIYTSKPNQNYTCVLKKCKISIIKKQITTLPNLFNYSK